MKPLETQPPASLTSHRPTQSHTAQTGVNAALDGTPIGASVLLVEDDAISRKVAKRMLEKLGCHVDTATNGKKAIKMVDMLPYDIVFMDCQMPEMDGYQATAEIRRHEEDTKHVPIIAVTAHAMKEDRERCLEAGMDDYVTKPLQPEDLRALLEQWVASPSSSEPSEGASASDRIFDAVVDENAPTPLDAGTLACLKDLVKGNKSFLKDLFEAFLNSTIESIAALRQAVNAKDTVALKESAHTLKGRSGNIGAQGMMEICQRLEALVHPKSMAEAGKLIEALDQEFKRVTIELKAQL